MKEYIRTDTFKVYKPHAIILQSIIEKKKLSARQGKSEAYRVALDSWEMNEKICAKLDEFVAVLNKVIEGQDQSYFVMQALVAQMNESRKDLK